MRIIGSGKIDDYKKVAMEDSVLRAIDAKPGDSVLFYRRHNEDNVCIYRAEGAKITTEADAPRRRHMMEAYVRMRSILIIALVAVVIRLLITVFNFSLLGPWRFALTFAIGIVTLVCVVLAIYMSEVVDKPYDPQSLVTVGSTYSKNRLTGISRLTTDGFVATGNLYVNSLFGANPSSVDVEVVLDDGEEFKGVVTELKVVPGYSVYKVHIHEQAASSGRFTVKSTYKYLGKVIVVSSHFDMVYEEGKQDLKIKEGPVDAEMAFDQHMNDIEFDESWINPNNDMY